MSTPHHPDEIIAKEPLHSRLDELSFIVLKEPLSYYAHHSTKIQILIRQDSHFH